MVLDLIEECSLVHYFPIHVYIHVFHLSVVKAGNGYGHTII